MPWLGEAGFTAETAVASIWHLQLVMQVTVQRRKEAAPTGLSAFSKNARYTKVNFLFFGTYLFQFVIIQPINFGHHCSILKNVETWYHELNHSIKLLSNF